MPKELIEIESLTVEGEGLGKDKKGQPHFIPFSIPGEKFVVSEGLLERKGSGSLDRVSPVCPVFHACGGCDYLHIDYPRQLIEKMKLLEFYFKKSGLPLDRVQPIRPSPSPLFYRNRVHLKVEADRLGFYKRKTHELVDVEKCFLAHPKLNEALYQIRKEQEMLEHKSLELGLEGDAVVKRWDCLQGESGFRQVNGAQNDFLKASLQEKIQQSSPQKVLELYCGNGNLTFSYLDHVETVLAVDSSRNAIDEARRQGKEKLTFLVEEINAALIAKLSSSFLNQMDTVVLDPPRLGMGPLICNFLFPKVKNIFYVSCSLVSFCRDAKLLQERGFLIQWVQPIDMFPQTRHLELLAAFQKNDSF